MAGCIGLELKIVDPEDWNVDLPEDGEAQVCLLSLGHTYGLHVNRCCRYNHDCHEQSTTTGIGLSQLQTVAVGDGWRAAAAAAVAELT